mmetsp:Transcript_85878/g.229022  ORF Transcript_85878/g.229022 Transcript_85878/m.229022 type:complete len:229 (+) Transcript_85878:1502-2188(+)
MTKMELEDQREQVRIHDQSLLRCLMSSGQAWEDYQACPVDDANRDKLYDKWQQLGERISEFQKRETEKKQAIQRITHNVALINTQNKSNNRSVNRKIEIRTNDTTSRPYVMTSYWDLGSQAQNDKPKAPKAAASDAVATLPSPRTGAAEDGASGEAVQVAEALKEAHLSLSAEIDLERGLGRDATLREAPSLTRAHNPLNPVRTGPKPGSKAISFEEYQRRKGLVSDT